MKYSLTSKGDWKKTFDFFNKGQKIHETAYKAIESGAKAGVNVLAKATPKDTGKAASSWGYEIEKKYGETSIFWTNNDTNKGYNIIVLLAYGHGTGTGGYVKPRDFINPVMKPIYKSMADTVWKEVIK